MNFISKVLVVAGFSTILFLINCPALLAATSSEDVKGGVVEGQKFVEEVTGNSRDSKGQLADLVNKEQSGSSPGRIEIRSIPPDEAAGQINNFFSGAYGLVTKISPEGLVVALVLLLISGPFISNFIARLALTIFSYFAIQNLPFIVGVFQGVASKMKI